MLLSSLASDAISGVDRKIQPTFMVTHRSPDQKEALTTETLLDEAAEESKFGILSSLIHSKYMRDIINRNVKKQMKQQSQQLSTK